MTHHLIKSIPLAKERQQGTNISQQVLECYIIIRLLLSHAFLRFWGNTAFYLFLSCHFHFVRDINN